MKRELTADLRSEIFPRFQTEITAFTDRIGARLTHIYDDLSQALSAAILAKRRRARETHQCVFARDAAVLVFDYRDRRQRASVRA